MIIKQIWTQKGLVVLKTSKAVDWLGHSCRLKVEKSNDFVWLSKAVMCAFIQWFPQRKLLTAKCKKNKYRNSLYGIECESKSACNVSTSEKEDTEQHENIK